MNNSNEKSKELPKGVCPSCWGKKYNSVMSRETGRGDFFGDPDYDSGSHIDNIPCSKCKGTGKFEPQSIPLEIDKCECKEGASDMCKACHLPTQTESEEPCPTCKTGVIKNGIHHTKPTPDNNYKI